MRCEICGKPASVHVTHAFTSGQKKDSHHYCVDHADRGGMSKDQVQRLRDDEAAAEDFTAFVKATRRVPSVDELQEIGVLRTSDPDLAKHLAFWTQVAEAMLADDEETRS